MKMSKKKMLKELRGKIVKQAEKEVPESEFEEIEHSLQEDKEETSEGLGIEEEEHAGSEPYPEIEEAEKDPDESEEEE